MQPHDYQITAVWGNTPPALSKTFQDFVFFCIVNQTITIASTVFVKKWWQYSQAEAANVNVGGKIPGLGNFMVIDAALFF